MPERWERKPERWAVDGCEQCGMSDTCELKTTGRLLPLWIDNDTGETVCEQCKRIRSNSVLDISRPPNSDGTHQ